MSESLQPFLAEIALALGALALLAMARFASLAERAGDFVLLVVAFSTVGAVVALDAPQGFLVARMTVADPFGAYFRFVLSMCALGTVWLSTRSRESAGRGGAAGWAFFLVSLLGMDLMVSSVHALAAWTGFAIAGISSAVWAGWRDSATSRDSSASLLVENAAASVLLLLGFVLLYGITGSFEYSVIASRRSLALAAPGGSALLFSAIALVFAALAWRLALLPFHSWRGSLALGSPIAVSAWMETGGSIAACAMLLRFVEVALGGSANGAGEAALWPELLSLAAMATLLAGSVEALREHELRRLVAWLALAQSGALVMALATLSETGVAALLFHASAFALAVVGALAALAPVIEQAGSSDFEILRGLARRRGGARAVAVAFALFLLSLAAVPPLAGHAGRSVIFTAVLASGRPVLALIAMASSAVALLVCVRVLATLLDRPADPDEPLQLDFEAGLLVALLAAGTIVVGLLPEALTSLTQRSVVFFGG